MKLFGKQIALPITILIKKVHRWRNSA